MEKIKVVKRDVYRDGGTTVYEDILNRQYFTFMYHLNRKVWNQFPDFIRRSGAEPLVKPYVKEILVELEIVESF